jgi:hypothetical protein
MRNNGTILLDVKMLPHCVLTEDGFDDIGVLMETELQEICMPHACAK